MNPASDPGAAGSTIWTRATGRELAIEYSKPYAIKLGTLELAIFDSSEAGEERLDPKQASVYAEQLASLHLRQNAWLVTHIPFWGFKAGEPSGPPVALSASLEEGWNQAAPKNISMILSGHVHLFEFLTFAGGRPPQLVARDRRNTVGDVHQFTRGRNRCSRRYSNGQPEPTEVGIHPAHEEHGYLDADPEKPPQSAGHVQDIGLSFHVQNVPREVTQDDRSPYSETSSATEE